MTIIEVYPSTLPGEPIERHQAHDATPCEMCAFGQTEYAFLGSIIELKGRNTRANHGSNVAERHLR